MLDAGWSPNLVLVRQARVRANALALPASPLRSLGRKRTDEYDVELSLLHDWLSHDEATSRSFSRPTADVRAQRVDSYLVPEAAGEEG